MRVVTLLPSATEIVCAVGAEAQLVGRSHSCDYPATVRNLPALTRTTVPENAGSLAIDRHVRTHLGSHAALYHLDLAGLEAACPDVIVSQRLCDVCAVSSDELESRLNELSSRPRLVDLKPRVLGDVFDDILRVGEALNANRAACRAVEGLRRRLLAVEQRTAAVPAAGRPRVALLEWLLPPFNSGHWNPELIEAAGGIDCLGPKGRDSHTVDWQDVLKAQPDVVVVASCGFSRRRCLEDIRALETEPGWSSLIRQVSGRVYVADGNAYFSRPGPRLIDSLEALAHALHPDIHPRPANGREDGELSGRLFLQHVGSGCIS